MVACANHWRIVTPVLLLCLVVWIWGLAVVLFTIRWNALERPGPPVRELFPYGAMRVGVDASLPPFAVATATDLFGLDIDLANAIGEELGIPVQFVNMGYDGLYDSIRADQVDVVISALLIDPNRGGQVRYTRHYFNAGLVLVSPAGSDFHEMTDMPGHRLAFEFGSGADAEARRWERRIESFTRMPYELPDYALDAVRIGDADAALVDATSMRLYIREHSSWAAQYSPVTDAWFAIAIRPDRVELWQAVNRALQAIDDNGLLDEIINRWL